MDARKAHKASSSSSPSTSSSKRWKYQVFLSFRGEDTRKGFTGHLHAALSHAGISAFLDDNELKRAEFIKTQLEQAIDGSMISIIVFSKSYADSSWCLDELVKIMECREKLGQQVIPLFYNVEASDVRKQTGSFALAFEKHEAGICEGKHEKEKVQRWRNALSQAADLCGEDLKNADSGHRSEAELIHKIVQDISRPVIDRTYLYATWVEWAFLLTALCLEILSLAFDQATSPSKPQYALFGMILAIAAVLICIWELIYKGIKGSVVLRPWGRLWWFYYPDPPHRLFGTVLDFYGLVGGIAQCICSTVQYVFFLRHADNPIKASLWPAIFVICLGAKRLNDNRNEIHRD